jgi:hypothetical protein
MLQLKLCQEPTENSQKQHKKLPEIFFPALGVVGVVVNFHKYFLMNIFHRHYYKNHYIKTILF